MADTLPKGRRTRQKEAVLQGLRQAGRALSMEEVLEAGRSVYPGLSERTVFRHLRELMEERQLVRVYLPGQPARYELPTGKHCPHFICQACNQVFVMPAETPSVIEQYPLPAGFEATGEEVIFFGQCIDCRQPTAR